MSELRWHPLLGDWVIIATHRQDRTFLPADDQCPLCPTVSEEFVTEINRPTYDIVTFTNRFPSLQHPAPVPDVLPTALSPVALGEGECEVISYTPNHNETLADQSVERIQHLVRVWRHRYEELGSRDFIKYVEIFENKGTVIGVTLQHPHGQIYGYPFVPPIPARRIANEQSYFVKEHRCLTCDQVAIEIAAGQRIVASNDHFVAAVPFYARWPYEVHIWSRSHRGSLSDFSPSEDRALADITRSVIRGYDRLPGFENPFPYMMVMYQRPSDFGSYDGVHFGIEFYPPHRRPGRLKYLAAVETGMGTWINDTRPEETAQSLARAVALGQKEDR